MPSASNKVATQFSTTEGQDHMKQVLLVVEKKIRNIEKKKAKLEGYKDLVKSGKDLNEDQRQSLRHYDEVLGNLDFAKELHKTFQTLATDYAKMEKKRNKRELVVRQEQEQKTIQTILLLQNVLDNMGQTQIRSDFEAGKNGAIVLTEQELTYLDEFYKIACPSREEDDESQPKESFEKKRVAAGEHLSKYVRCDETAVCGTTYKELNSLIQRIEQCGYLDNIPDTQELSEETETELREDEYLVSNPETLPAQDASAAAASLQQEVSLKKEVETMPVHTETMLPPEPIEFPQETKPRNLDEVLKSVQGSFSFVQDPIDFDAPHLVDPAVVSVSQHSHSQSYRAQQLSYGTSDPSMIEHNQPHQTLESLQQSGGQVLDHHLLQGTSQSHPPQSSSEQSYNVDQDTVLQSNTSPHTSSTYNQSNLAPDQYTSSDHYVAASDQYTSAGDQYSQSTDQYGNPRLTTSTDYTQQLGSSSQYSNQVADSAFQQEPITQQGQLPSSAMSIAEPQMIALPTDSQVTTQATTQSSVTIPKSTMNASAPPFQSSMTYQMQSTPPTAVSQAQDAFQNMGSAQVTESYGSSSRTPDPVNSDVSGSSSYQQQYQGGYRSNNRGNRSNRGNSQNTGYRSNRGGQQYNRGFSQQNYMPRNTFQTRGSDVQYSTGNGGANTMHTSGAFQNSYRSMPPDNGYQSYERRTNMPRGGNQRGGRGQGPRPGYNNRGRGGFNKAQQLTV